MAEGETCSAASEECNDCGGFSSKSIHTGGVGKVYEVPFSALTKPIPSELDESKVQRMMEILKDDKQRESLTPVDVMWVETEKGNYYFCFGGCHRYEATKRLKLATMRAKVVKVPPSVVRDYMGASSPF